MALSLLPDLPDGVFRGLVPRGLFRKASIIVYDKNEE